MRNYSLIQSIRSSTCILPRISTFVSNDGRAMKILFIFNSYARGKSRKRDTLRAMHAPGTRIRKRKVPLDYLHKYYVCFLVHCECEIDTHALVLSKQPPFYANTSKDGAVIFSMFAILRSKNPANAIVYACTTKQDRINRVSRNFLYATSKLTKWKNRIFRFWEQRKLWLAYLEMTLDQFWEKIDTRYITRVTCKTRKKKKTSYEPN